MSAKIAVLEGYSLPNFDGYKRKHRKGRKGGKAAQKARFKKAAKACKGRKLHAFRACMRSKLRK